MRRALWILILIAVTIAGQAQELVYQDNPAICHADFTALTDPFDPMIIQFQDKSTGQITNWQWSFGDGATSTTQNPTHTYPAGGTYFVCLTVYNSDSGSICHDVLCLPITIHEPGACVADYSYELDVINHLQVHFNDKSSGNINSWHWDFGDGTFSDDRNPSHTFPDIGKFRVCLTAYNADSVAVCQDIKCDSITIHPPPVCHAMFSAELDSINHIQNTFRFENNSTGDPNEYLWKFDDGSTYMTRDVIHHFELPGTHEVCLYITRKENDVIVCKDSICQTVTTAKYFNIGGHLFAGASPINNPFSTGDTGIASIFRKDGNNIILIDEMKFTELGYFTFPDVLNGYYLIKAKLTSGSANYSKYFPAYFPQGLTWKESQFLDLSNASSFSAHIYLLPADDSLTGPGMIKGLVFKTNPDLQPITIPFAEVILYDAQYRPRKFAVSDESGHFEFSGLPYGAYNLYVDFPGMYSRTTVVWLDPDSPVADSMRLEIFDYDVTGIGDANGGDFKAGELFPNPAGGVSHIIIQLQKRCLLKIEIYAMNGVIVHSGSKRCEAGSNLITLPVGNIPPGIYLFAIKSEQGALLSVKKMVK